LLHSAFTVAHISVLHLVEFDSKDGYYGHALPRHQRYNLDYTLYAAVICKAAIPYSAPDLPWTVFHFASVSSGCGSPSVGGVSHGSLSSSWADGRFDGCHRSKRLRNRRNSSLSVPSREVASCSNEVCVIS
jgi:hypothetical protein